MYVIDTSKTMADIGYTEYRVQQMMSRGIKVGNIEPIYNYYNNMTEILKNEIAETYGIANVNSSKQITEYLERLSNQVDMSAKNDIVNICYSDEDMKWTSNAEALGKLADLGYDVASDVLSYRKAKKYADSVKNLMEYMDENRLIHPVVTLSKTNRINYSKPALMNIPKKLLWNLIAPISNDDVLYSVDIKNQEPSILINYLDDATLKEALQAEGGLYENLFKKVFSPTVEMNMDPLYLEEQRIYSIDELRQVPFVEPAMYLPKKAECKSFYYNNERIVAVETICQGYKPGCEIQYPDKVMIETDARKLYEVDVTWRKNFKPKKSDRFTIIGDIHGVEFRLNKAERKEFKVAWNALAYGASAFGIKRICKIIDGMKIYRFFNGLESFKKYKKLIDSKIKDKKYSIPTIFGTMVDAGETDPKRLKRILLDIPIQGTGSDILSCLIKHFDDETKKLDISDKVFIYYTRHDELIIEVNKAWRSEVGEDYVSNLLRNTLEHQIVLNGKEWIPFKVEVDELKPLELQIYEEEDE